MKAKITSYFIPLLILAIILTFSSFSCSTPGPAGQTIEEPTKVTTEEIPVEEHEEEIEEEVVGEQPEEEPSEDEQNLEVIEFKCIRVVDGDTIEIEDINGEKYKVRYIGINTPETDEYYGDIATEKNRGLVKGKIVKVEKDVSETDKYGRLLRYVYVDDLFVNAYLVENGFAQVATYPPDVKYADLFLELQQEAMENKKGLWGTEVAEEQEQEQSQQQGNSQEQQTEQAQEEEQQQEEEQTYGIEVVSLTSPISRGSQASITINTAPNIQCNITVYYKSGPSKAKGLGPKNSDGNGSCTWSWEVGSRTTPGDWKIVLAAEGVGQIETYFTVME